jgi:hypothetical protein
LWTALRSTLVREGASPSELEKVVMLSALERAVMLSALERAGESPALEWEMRLEWP